MTDAPHRHGRNGRNGSAGVVIPAYNEEHVLGRCLDALMPHLAATPVPASAPSADPPEARAQNSVQEPAQEPNEPSTDDGPGGGALEVVVAANGCTDRTVEVASRYPVTVLDIETGSKSLALNRGDEALRSHPRIYLDADIVLSPDAVPAMIEALSVEDAIVAAPSIVFDVSRSSGLVRAFYRVFRELPYVRDGLVGLGVYGVSRAGRERFESFPDLVADDLYIQRLFAPHERRTVAGTFTVTAPRTLSDLLAVRVRIARGNAGLAAHSADDRFTTTTGSTSRALVDLVRTRPSRTVDALVYLAVTLVARGRATRTRPGDGTAWERDDSTRA